MADSVLNRTLGELLTDGSQVTQLVDADGNSLGGIESVDGSYLLGVSMEQKVITDTNNSSIINLTSTNSYTFTGTASSTLGVAALQWNLKTDQNATVYIEQSDNGTNWDISDSFNYYYSKGGAGNTVQAVAAYWRIRIVLTGTTDTTYFRLLGILCPMANPLPRALNSYERLKTSGGIVDEESGNRAEVDTLGTLRTMTPVRLIGASFLGTTKDTNFWTEVVTGTGSITQAGEILVATGTTANSTSAYYANRKARKVTGATNQFRAVAKLGTATQANNLRRLGCYDANDGFFFQVNGTTFGVGARKGSVDTIVTSGSFNGNYGATVTMDTNIKMLIIEYDHLSTKFFVNGVLLHTIIGSTVALTNTLNLGIYMENNNSGGNVTNNTFYVRFACISRLGELLTTPLYYHISGNAATYVLKYGAGVLHNVVYNNTSGTSLTIYDGVSAAGAVVGIITTASAALGVWNYEIPFSNGLTIVTVGNSLDATIVYE